MKQDGDLKKQLHDRQTRITAALSDKQKLAVRSCPIGTPKPLSLIKPPSQGITISVVPAKAPVSMVTAHINGQKAASSEALQTSPINLGTGGRAAAGVQSFSSRRAGELPPSQMLGALTAVPIKVPQVGSLHRLAGQAATVLPQVRPKTQIPDSLPHSPCQELQPLSLQRATAVVSPKSQGPTLPTANCTFNTEYQPNGQADSSPPPTILTVAADSNNPTQHASAGPGVAYAIIAASPASSNGMSTVSEAVKVIIIQPQAPSSTEGPTVMQADLSSQEAPPTPSLPTPKKEEDPEKVAFMVALGLVTTNQLEEIQTKRQERKRRSTANPAYSGLFEPERKRLPSSFLNSALFLSAQDSEDLCWKDDLEHEELCAVCKQDGELQPCHNCPQTFHPNCLHPPLRTPPRGPWYCPKCQKKVLNKENTSWPQNFVQSYITHKSVRQEEKRRLLRRNGELKKECAHLEEEDKNLNKTFKRCMDVRDRLLGQQRDTQASLDRLKSLIRLIQRDQLIHVTMTTIATSLHPQPWIKATSSTAIISSTLSQCHDHDD
ncbi:PHD finger protein 21B isoform X2 [Thalassophryne amazonica]|uniref:PHD finger protein 21B isoform X2 n=1 Tax=Thalassophryne amazonica TaxID=390379 RepID=UPI00147097F0|nr:PHD finger protein 21B isoform X2 [Thalassophryne amazonica]